MNEKDLTEKLESFAAVLGVEKSGNDTDILSSLETWEAIRAMDVKMEWIVDRIIPKSSITLVFGKGGIGKTWLMLDMARCIGSGTPYVGLNTIKTPVVFVDFENPLAVLNARTQKLGNGEGVFFWRANNALLKAPKLDREGWEIYKQLPEGTLLIFDTLRAAQDRNENASDEMSLVMGRLKELRDIGFTIVLLHHTAKNRDNVAKGSTAIVDLADHILGLTLVRKKADGQEIIADDEDDDDDLVYRFGFREKTRFEPYQIHLTLNPDRGFDLSPDPQEEALKRIHAILLDLGETDKTRFIEKIREQSGIGLHKARKLFEIGQGRYWKVEKGSHNKQIVTPIQLVSLSPLYSGEELKSSESVIQPRRIAEAENGRQCVNNKELFSYSNGLLRDEKQPMTVHSATLTSYAVGRI